MHFTSGGSGSWLGGLWRTQALPAGQASIFTRQAQVLLDNPDRALYWTEDMADLLTGLGGGVRRGLCEGVSL